MTGENLRPTILKERSTRIREEVNGIFRKKIIRDDLITFGTREPTKAKRALTELKLDTELFSFYLSLIEQLWQTSKKNLLNTTRECVKAIIFIFVAKHF